jgi:hypothetical protein
VKNNTIAAIATSVLFLFVTILALPHYGMCSEVYTVGEVSYDQALADGKPIMKLGPIPAGNVPPIFPKSFLEPDGSYGGGIVYQSVENAKDGLAALLKNGTLPAGLEWHIYQLDAEWENDVYELKKGDYRLKKPCPVEKRIQ